MNPNYGFAFAMKIPSESGSKHNHASCKLLCLREESFKILFAFKAVFGIAQSCFVKDETDMHVNPFITLVVNLIAHYLVASLISSIAVNT